MRPATPEEKTERALAHLRDTIVFEGPATVAAVLIETVVGTNGVLVPRPGYHALAVADRYYAG